MSEGIFVLPPPSHEGSLPYVHGVSSSLTPYPLETLSIPSSPVFLAGYCSGLIPLREAMCNSLCLPLKPSLSTLASSFYPIEHIKT
jgi:hypothetical protein